MEWRSNHSSSFYHVGANTENRNAVNEALVIKPGFVYNGELSDIPLRPRQENDIDVEIEENTNTVQLELL